MSRHVVFLCSAVLSEFHSFTVAFKNKSMHMDVWQDNKMYSMSFIYHVSSLLSAYLSIIQTE